MKAGTAHDNAQATINELKARVALLEKAVREDHAYKSGTTGELVCVHCHRSHPNTVEHIPHFTKCIVLTCKEDKA